MEALTLAAALCVCGERISETMEPGPLMLQALEPRPPARLALSRQRLEARMEARMLCFDPSRTGKDEGGSVNPIISEMLIKEGKMSGTIGKYEQCIKGPHFAIKRLELLIGSVRHGIVKRCSF